MKTFRRFACGAALMLALGAQAAPDLDAPIRELKLTDGRVLRGVQLKSYNSKGVMLRHEGGVAQIGYELFPEDYRAAVLAKKPAPSAPTPARPDAVPGPAAPSAPRPAAAAANVALDARMVPGAVYIKAKRTNRALAGVELRLYPLETFAEYDHIRRNRFHPDHVQLRRRINGTIPGGGTGADALDLYYKTEYESWDGLPAPLVSAVSDDSGQFQLPVPIRGDWVLFARAQTDTEHYVWAVIVRGATSVELNTGNLFPSLKEE